MSLEMVHLYNGLSLIKSYIKLIIISESTFRMERGISKPMQPVPRFVQGKHEKDKNFIRRIELEAHRVILKAQIEEKYQVTVTVYSMCLGDCFNTLV